MTCRRHGRCKKRPVLKVTAVHLSFVPAGLNSARSVKYVIIIDVLLRCLMYVLRMREMKSSRLHSRPYFYCEMSVSKVSTCVVPCTLVDPYVCRCARECVVTHNRDIKAIVNRLQIARSCMYVCIAARILIDNWM